MADHKRILVSSPTFGEHSSQSRSLLRDRGYELVDLPRTDDPDRETIYEHLREVWVWIVGYTRVDEEALDRAPHLEIVAKHGTGVDNVDLEAASDRGVVVANAPGANANGVAELVVLHMLNYGRELVQLDGRVRERQWDSRVGTELTGKTLGIVGLGDIGQSVVRRTQSFDLEYLAHDVEERPTFQHRFDVTLVDDLHDMLCRVDFVTVHVPLNEHMRHLIGAEELECMKPDACLINTARGGLVDEDALVDALERDEIGGAALDVLEQEPPGDPKRYDSLLADERITFSPHIGGLTEEAMGEISDVTARNILNVLDGEEPRHRIV